MEIYALILAGGSGERFWPLSRRALPKQLLRLVSGCSLLEAAITRLDGLIPPSRILVLTNVDQEKGVRESLKEFSGVQYHCRAIETRHRRSRRARGSLGRRAQSHCGDGRSAGGSCH